MSFLCCESPKTNLYTQSLLRTLRTGDLILYNDAPRTWHYALARRLTNFLLSFPCAAPCFVSLEEGESDGDLTTLCGEWNNWQNAALIVCVDLAPHVFVSDGLVFSSVPLCDFLSNLAIVGRVSCAVRHLMVCKEDVVETYRSHSCVRRTILAKLFSKAHTTLAQTSANLPGTDALRTLLCEPRSAKTMPSVRPLPAIDYKLAFSASSAYTTLYTLYLARVLNTEPLLRTASQLVQSTVQLEQCMDSDYRYTKQQVFWFTNNVSQR